MLFFAACQKETQVVNQSNDTATESLSQNQTDNREVSNTVTARNETDAGFPCKVTVRLTVYGASEYQVKLKINKFPATVGYIEHFQSIAYPPGVYTFVYPQLTITSDQEITIFNPNSSGNIPNLPWFHSYSPDAYVKIEIIPENGSGYTYLMNNSTGKPTGFRYSRMFPPKTVYSIWGCSIQE